MVRTAFAIAAYFGANRIIELQTLKYGGNISIMLKFEKFSDCILKLKF